MVASATSLALASCLRLTLAAALLALLVPVLVLLAASIGWQQRLVLLPLLLLRYAQIDVEMGSLDATCAWAQQPLQRILDLDVPIDACTFTLEDVSLYSPFITRLRVRRSKLGTIFSSRAQRELEQIAIDAAASAAAAAAYEAVAATQSALRPSRRGLVRRPIRATAKLTSATGDIPVIAAASEAATAAASRAISGQTNPSAGEAKLGASSAKEGQQAAVPITPITQPGRDLFARAQSVVLHVRRSRKRRYIARLVVGAPAMRFVSYDHRFHDTNVKRLLKVLTEVVVVDGVTVPTAAAPQSPIRTQTLNKKGSLPLEIPPPSPLSPSLGHVAALSAEISNLVEVRSVELLRGRLDIILNLSPVATGGVPVLPPITTLAEKLDLAVSSKPVKGKQSQAEGKGNEGVAVAAPLSVGLLLQLNALAFRALASSSFDAVSSSLVAATAVAAALLGRSLEVVDSVNGPLLQIGLPGAELLRGATGAGRALVDGAVAGTGALLSGSVEATKHLAAAISSGSINEMARGIDRGARVLSAGVEGSVDALSTGLQSGINAVLGGVDDFSDRLGPARHVVRGVTGGARYVTAGLGSATTSVVGSVLDGGTQLLSDVAVGTAKTGLGLATFDLEQIAAGGGQLVTGLARGVGTLTYGARTGIEAVGVGTLRGLESATHGVAGAAGEVLTGVVDTSARASRFWLRPLAFLQRRDAAKKAREARERAVVTTAAAAAGSGVHSRASPQAQGAGAAVAAAAAVATATREGNGGSARGTPPRK
mmetsp:Transcript_13153/g.33409  ORF Transcript_13153/g.33409 Transcript_13153/m.33409 type:complete len:768 (-) Transcript_13153:127-2430(-)